MVFPLDFVSSTLAFHDFLSYVYLVQFVFLSPTLVSSGSADNGLGVGVEAIGNSITICFVGFTSACATTAVAINPARVYIVVSYRWGVGSRVPGGASSISLLIDSVFVARS